MRVLAVAEKQIDRRKKCRIERRGYTLRLRYRVIDIARAREKERRQLALGAGNMLELDWYKRKARRQFFCHR